MCENDFLLTYNPECLERHSDSTDFDDNDLSSIGGRNHGILRRKLLRKVEMANYEKEMRSKRYQAEQCVYDNHAVHPRQCNCNDCVIPVEEKRHQATFRKRKVKYYNEEDERSLHRTPSRLSVVRSKIIPCLSNIFGRSNHMKPEFIRDKHLVINSTKDNCCQVYCLDCNRKRIKRTDKKHNYLVQSLYSTETELNDSPDSGINVDSAVEQERDMIHARYNTNCEYISSPISENINTAKSKFKRMVEKEFKKAYLKRHSIRRTQGQQFPSKPNFQIFSTPKMSKIDHIQSEMRDISSIGCSVIPSSSSIFWEYLVERINKKYQTNNRGGLIRSCHCTNSTKCPHAAKDSSLLHDGTGSQFDYKTNEQATQGSVNNTMCDSHHNTQLVSPVSTTEQPSPCKRGGVCCQKGKPPQDLPLTAKKSTENLKVQCKCHTGGPPPFGATPGKSPKGFPGGPQAVEPESSSSSGPDKVDDTNAIKRPCQEPHDQLKASLEKKYNGEILCIHNPPCILINGCLNLPPVKGQFSPSAWPVTQVSSFCGFQRSNPPKHNQEQGCQYQPPSSEEIQPYPMTNVKSEKMTQSICNHDPPCEVVRCCYKPEFDPKLDNSCVHVPMCQKSPACILNEVDKSSKCEHEPKCADTPICKRQPKKYVVMTAKDDISTQVKPSSKLECKHVPPCIMIPKCLGRLMCEGYVPYEAIPDCSHQPPCEMIPACCRKSAKMVSTSSQYPASCRIV